MSKGQRFMQSFTGRTRALRAAHSLMGACAIALIAACSEPVTAPVAGTPSQAARRGLVGGVTGSVTNVMGLLRTTPVVSPISRSQTFGRAGGKLSIPEVGFSLKVPANAIPGDMLTITVSVIPGKMIAYNFEPHGTQFLVPLTFSQELGGTGWLTNLLRPQLSGGYFKADSQLNQTNGTALINESFSAVINNNSVSFDITHFSGYMVSSGRSDSDSSMQ